MEPAPSPIFRLRRAGRVLGPFPRTRIRLMARRGEVFLTDEVSLNGGQWLPVLGTPLAGELPRKPAVTLQGASSGATPASPAGDTVVALEVPWPVKPAAKPAPPEAKSRPAPVPAKAPTPVSAPAPAPAASEADSFADWAQNAPTYASRAVRRKPKPRKGGGLSLEAFFLGLLALLALAAIVGAAFWLGRRASPPAPVPVPVAAPASPAEPAEGQAFAGRTYGLRETPDGAVVMRLRLLAGGAVETIDATGVSPARLVAGWKVAGGELFLANASSVALYRFPARAEWKKLDGTFGGKKWRQLTLEGK